jgi:tetratricopeptide (TPR) repeat protein/DNA-binding response OmpR family regulator
LVNRRNASTAKTEPAVLVVGADEALLPALEAALARHRVFVEAVPLDAVVDAAVAAAPDLILLAGEAARDCGSAVLERLNASPQSSVVPVVILDDDTKIDARLRAFRHGAAAVLPRSASMDNLADQIAKLAREIPERGSENLGVLGESTLQEFIDALKKQLRTGILSLEAGEGDEQEAIRMVFGSGRPLADFVDDFVQRMRKHVMLAEPLRWEFDERAGGTIQLFGNDTPESNSSAVKDLRLVLADDDTGRADAISQELRLHGAQVIVTDFKPNETRVAHMRQFDPTILMIGEDHLQGDGYDLVRRMRHDTRLRWAGMLVVRWKEVWSEQIDVPVVERLAGTLAVLAEPETALRERASVGAAFDTRLEITGPARALRALCGVVHPIRMTVFNPRVRVEVDLHEGLIVGATAHTLTDPIMEVEGAVALSALLVLSSGRVHIEQVHRAAKANIMATVDVALNMAEAEPSPIVPSHPAPARPIGEENPDADTASALPVSREISAARRRTRSGVSGKMTALIIGLAALQGLALALVWRHFAQPKRTESAVASAEIAAAAASAVEATPLSRPPASPASRPTASAAPPALPVPAPAPAEQAAEKRAAQDAIFSDGSGERAPSCDALLATVPTLEGDYPGAAIEEIRKANRQLVLGNSDAAQLGFCRAVKWDNESALAATYLAQLLLLRRDGVGAAEWARRATEIDPSSKRTMGLLGDALARTGEIDAAKAAWLKASGVLAEDDALVRAMNGRDLTEAKNAIKKRDFARAERFFRRVLAFVPDQVEANLGLATALLRLGDAKPASHWAERATQLDPKDPEARVALGDAMSKLGQQDAAIMQWREAAMLDPNNRNARRRLRNAGVQQ